MGKIDSYFTGGIGKDNKPNRDRWIKKHLQNVANGLKILDAGAGQLQYKKYCSHLEYVSQDFCQYEGAGNNKALQTGVFDTSKIDIECDIIDIPVKDESFDVILCIEVIEHLPDPRKAIAEFTRILKRGGTLILTAPFASLTHFAPYHFSTGFNKYFYEDILKDEFTINELQANGDYFDYLAQEVRRISYVSEKYSGRRTNIFQQALIMTFLKMIKKLKKPLNLSHELLCYGYQVVATKKQI